jgi:hypothetical protein
MKKMLFIIMVMFLSSQIVYAQEVSVSYSSRTGDTHFDTLLSDLNVQARSDTENFTARLSATYGVSKPQIEVLLLKERIPPADVYMIVKTATVSNKPINVVEEKYKAHKNKGWGFIAKSLGIKPGSKEFHALKQDDSGILGKEKEKGPKKEKGGRGKGKSKGRDD